MKLLRTIRLDPSDTFVFERAAEPGEWAVPGGFVFFDADPDELTGKARAAFRAGLLGVSSLGWSTLAQIVEASEQDRAEAVAQLAQRLMERFGAPDLASARAAAEEEVAFAASLTDHPLDTLIAVHRTREEGAVRETFRTLRPRAGEKPLRAFAFMEVEGEEEPGEAVDLVGMAQGERAMNDFWLSCGHHLLDRDEGGGLLVTDEFLKVYLARPELSPPPDAGVVERTLHASVLADPRRPVTASDIAALDDPDARENWELMIAFRDRLLRYPTLEAAYLALVREGMSGTPPIFLNQLVHVILRNALDGCDDPFVLRAAELFFRPQVVTLHEGSLLAADEETISGAGASPVSPLVSMLGLPAASAIDVLGEHNAEDISSAATSSTWRSTSPPAAAASRRWASRSSNGCAT